MIIEGFPDCCGIDIICSFPGSSYPSIKSIENYLENVKKGKSRQGGMGPHGTKPGYYLIALNEDQATIYGKIVEKQGWRVLVRTITNPKTTNKITLYGRHWPDENNKTPIKKKPIKRKSIYNAT